MKHIGKQIFEAIRKKGLKQKEAAELMGMSAVNLSHIFNKKSIHADLLEMFINKLDISVYDIFEINKPSMLVAEPLPSYTKKEGCENCKQLERIIESQNRLIERLEKEIDDVKGELIKRNSA